MDSRVYSYFIDATDGAGGLLFGGVDRARLNGSITWVPVEPRADGEYTSWSGRLVSVNGNASITNSSSVSIMFDTGTSLIHTSLGVAERLHENLGFPEPTTLVSTLYTLTFMDCPNGTIPEVLKPATFTLANGANLTLQPAQYLRYLDVEGYPTQCISLFTGLSNLPEERFIFGNAFLKSFYTIYDTANLNVGFAPVNRAVGLAANYSVLASAEILPGPTTRSRGTSSTSMTAASSAQGTSTASTNGYATTTTTSTLSTRTTSTRTSTSTVVSVPKGADALHALHPVLGCAVLLLLPFLGGLLLL